MHGFSTLSLSGMGLSLASFVFGSRESVHFVTRLSHDEAIQRLNAQVVPWGHDGLRGKASEKWVSFQFVSSPFRRNSFRPVFEGRFETTPNGTTLVGTIGTHRIAQFLMISFMVVGVLLAARDLVAGNASEPPTIYGLRWLWLVPVTLVVSYFGRIAGAQEGESLRNTLRWTLDPQDA